MQKKTLTALALAAQLLAASAANALLATGSPAPDFSTRAALAGKPFDFRLSEALKKGPVVLFFYPKAFTKGCTLEAHLFAEASERFAALNAMVVGVSNDDIATLEKFSVEACRNRFAVAADPDGATIRAYDARMLPGVAVSSRVSYVITPDGKVFYHYQSMDPAQHVERTLAALKAWKNGSPPPPAD